LYVHLSTILRSYFEAKTSSTIVVAYIITEEVANATKLRVVKCVCMGEVWMRDASGFGCGCVLCVSDASALHSDQVLSKGQCFRFTEGPGTRFHKFPIYSSVNVDFYGTCFWITEAGWYPMYTVPWLYIRNISDLQ
jgi:hypothetical protein